MKKAAECDSSNPEDTANPLQYCELSHGQANLCFYQRNQCLGGVFTVHAGWAPSFFVLLNWLQVFQSADAARRGQRERCTQKNAWHVVAAHGPDMRLPAVFVGPHTPEAQTAHFSIFQKYFKDL